MNGLIYASVATKSCRDFILNVYDPKANQWIDGLNMPITSGWHEFVTLNNCIYAINCDSSNLQFHRYCWAILNNRRKVKNKFEI